MITPALDLQAAPQMVDGVRAQAAQPDGSSESGDFGAAFTASLSSSPTPTAYVSDSETSGAQRSLPQNPANVRDSSDRSAPALKSPVGASGSATSARPTVKAAALTLPHAGAKDSGGEALSEALASVTTKTGAVSADSSDGKAAAQPLSKSSEPLNAVAVDPQFLLKNKGAVVDDKANSVAAINVAELQASLVGSSRPLTSEVSETSKTSPLNKGSETAAKNKVSAHDSQPVASSTTANALLASVGTGAPVLTTASLTTATPAKETSVEAVNAPKARLSLPRQNPEASAAGLSGTAAAAIRISLANAWNSVQLEASSGRSAVTTGSDSRTAGSELVHALGLSGGLFGTAAAPGAGGGLSSASELPTPPIHWPTAPVATDVQQNGEAAASLASTGLREVPAATGKDLRSEALSAGASSASPVGTTARPASIATDTLSSSIPSKPQAASVEPVAGRSLNPAGPVKNSAAGVFASIAHAVEGTAQSESTQAAGAAAASASSVQADTKSGQIGNQPHTGPGAAAPTTSKQSAVLTERTSSPHTSIAAAGTEAVSSSHRGLLDDSAATPDRGASSDAIGNVMTGHGDSSAAAAIPGHTASTPTLDLSTGSIAATANLAATVAHQGSAGATSAITPGAVGAVGSSAVQTAGTEALHGAGALSGAIASEPHQTLAATPTSLEVGVHSGTQGWLKIRAEVGDQGDVTASLASGSTSGQQILKGQLPALNAYLQSEQMSVTTSVAERIGATHVAVAHQASLGSSSAGTGSAGQDTSLLQSGAGPGTFEQGGGHQGSGLDRSPVNVDSGRSERVQSYANGVESNGSTPGSNANDGSGRWLNVRV